MKITIEPSHKTYPIPHPTSMIDTNTNDDSTQEIVEAAFQVIVCNGHHWQNVVEAAERVCREIRSVNSTTKENK